MSYMHVHVRKVDNVIVTGMTRGRILALHDHRCWRIAKKYHRAMVFLRPMIDRGNLPTLVEIIRNCRAFMSTKAMRRVCKELRKRGIDAHVER